MASWEIFRELDSLRREIDEAFRGAGMPRPFGPKFLMPASTRPFPMVNVGEDDGSIYVEALVPGVDPNEVELSVLKNTLTITGERKPNADVKGVVHRSELGAGKFCRTLELPAEIDAEKVVATYKDGLLTITMGKAEHARPKKVAIQLS